MPVTRVEKSFHVETHKVSRGALFRNIILGTQDGVVNVLGIVLGVATATNSSYLVLLAGLAATFAESLSMAAVAYTSSRAEAEHYKAELHRELDEMEQVPEKEREEIEQIFREKGFSGKLLKQVVNTICSDRKVWLKTMMRDELGLEDPTKGMSSFQQGVLVGVSSFIGSLIPITAFFFLPVAVATPIGLLASLIVLFGVGAYKSKLMSGKWLWGGLELMIIGGTAALAGYLIGDLFKVPNP